jgi:hypothetical protein
VNTTGPQHAQLMPSGSGTQIVMALFPMSLLLLGSAHKKLRREFLRRVSRIGLLLGVVCLACLHIGCGGGGSSSPTSPAPPNNFTPSGTYTLTITATQGTAMRNMNLTLQVQ